MKKIAVLLGGTSTESKISLKTGTAVSKALERRHYRIASIDPASTDWSYQLDEFNPDLVFIGLHGHKGEDGCIQGYLETKNYVYTGSNVLASAMTMNKIVTQRMLRLGGLPVPKFITLSLGDYQARDKQTLSKEIVEKIGLPLVIKAPSQGSTIGIYFISQIDEINDGIESAFTYEQTIIIEKMIKGMEITVAVLGNDNPVALPTLEITTTTGTYDYETKYTPGMSEHIIPARLPKEVRKSCQEMAVRAYLIMGVRGFGRVDFMLDEALNPYILELNTIPGMTETSLIPDAAAHVDISFEELVEGICLLATDKPWPALERLQDETTNA